MSDIRSASSSEPPGALADVSDQRGSRVSELEGAMLDAAVAMAEGYRFRLYKVHADGFKLYALSSLGWKTLGSCGLGVDGEWSENIKRYSRSWADGGPIIHRERIHLSSYINGEWAAFAVGPDRVVERIVKGEMRGTTPLIAAMRAYVYAKLGEYVQLPTQSKPL